MSRQQRSRRTRWLRWLATFIGFPLAGVAARVVVGDIDGVAPALAGGFVGGVVLGSVQAIVGGIGNRTRWIAATAIGLATGLAAGAAAVGYRTDGASLAVMGLVSGAAAGLAQAVAGPLSAAQRVAWALATPALWALGWSITARVIVDADRHHAMFGSSGALAVSALAGVVVVFLAPPAEVAR